MTWPGVNGPARSPTNRYATIAGRPKRRAAAPRSAAAKSTRPSSRSGVASVTRRGYAPAVPGRIDTFRIPTRIQLGRGGSLTVATPPQQSGAKKVLLRTHPRAVQGGPVGPVQHE